VSADGLLPVTASDIKAVARDCGIGAGDVLVMHCSVGALGYVVGGPQAILDGLFAAVGGTGTLTMPAQTGDWSDPAGWVAPPVPESWWETIRENTPPFDPYRTPPQRIGALADALLLRRETLRSNHPRLSHMACGPHAQQIVDGHALDEGFGEHSPLARLYELDAKVVLIGVGHGSNTSLHLAETRASWPSRTTIEQGARMMVNGESRWVTYTETDHQTDDFDSLGSAFEQTGAVATAPLGRSAMRVMHQRQLVDFATDWFSANRQ